MVKKLATLKKGKKKVCKVNSLPNLLYIANSSVPVNNFT